MVKWDFHGHLLGFYSDLMGYSWEKMEVQWYFDGIDPLMEYISLLSIEDPIFFYQVGPR
jgi:hypothetical protein